MNWTEFRKHYRKSSVQPQLFSVCDKAIGGSEKKLASLHCWIMAEPFGRRGSVRRSADLEWGIFAADVHQKILHRGRLTFPQVEVEEAILEFLPVQERGSLKNPKNSIELEPGPELIQRWQDFTIPALAETRFPSDYNPFDPEHPDNEAVLYDVLRDIGGDEILSVVHTQVGIDQFLPEGTAGAFSAQRADFIIVLPSGQGLVLEPGDHGDSEELRDRQRDRAFKEAFGFETLRPTNAEITSDRFREELKSHLGRIGVEEWLEGLERNPGDPAYHAAFLAGPFIARMEACLLDRIFCSRLWSEESICIGIAERDGLPLAGLAVRSFLSQQEKIHRLYGEPFQPPAIALEICEDVPGKLNPPAEESAWLNGFGGSVARHEGVPESVECDLLIDISVCAGNLLGPICKNPEVDFVLIRNCHSHHDEPTFNAPKKQFRCPRGKMEERGLPFLKDLFRKPTFRSKQDSILESILARKDTIGLLPTGGGKSLCYQLAGLVTPGTTLVVDPIIALMDDQVSSLKNRYCVDRVSAVHSGGEKRLNSGELSRLLETSLFLFLSPERFQRQTFRDALGQASFSHKIGLAVIDEAHCVSMWGHDFRPAYLRLAENIRSRCYADSDGPPAILALTGTASQLVLIDLKRILKVEIGSIVRPETFDREELHYFVFPCQKADKANFLRRRILPHLGDQLRVSPQDLIEKSWGIIFDYTPKNLWKLMGELDAFSRERIEKGGWDSSPINDLRIGIYTGKCPADAGTELKKKWNGYKRKVFQEFSDGKIRCLFGNNAVSVGIDNPDVEYVVNMTMPESLEAYYQQAGRAGRNEQPSFCYLLFSESNPDRNNAWFLDGASLNDRESDVNTAAYFHSLNFPGVEKDLFHFRILIMAIVKMVKEKSSQTIRIDQKALGQVSHGSGAALQIENAERFVGYVMTLGIVADYTLEGMGDGTVVVLELTLPFFLGLTGGDAHMESARQSLIDSLSAYYGRYKLDPGDVAAEIEEKRLLSKEQSFVFAAAKHLMGFLYDRIAYQRRQAIRDITRFCRDSAGKPEGRAREIIRNYFDRSEFSEFLVGMRESAADYSGAAGLIEQIDDPEKAERLYWECSRLLSEQEREDWLVCRMCAGIVINQDQKELSDEMAAALKKFGPPFFHGFAHALERLTKVVPVIRKDEWMERLVAFCYEDPGLRELVLKCVSPEPPGSFDSFAPLIAPSVRNYLAAVQLQRLTHALR